MKKWESPEVWILGVENTAANPGKGNGSSGGTVPPPGMPNKIAGEGDDLYVTGGHWEIGWTSRS